MEYRVSFIAQTVGMMINDLVFFIFWAIYFARFSNVAGWGMGEVALIWAVAATAIGLGVALFGNCTRVSSLVMQGQLDYYLVLPKAPLPHVLVSRMGLAGWGDVCFGLLAFALFGPHELLSIALYALLVVASMLVFVSFMVMAGSLAFFIGSAEAAAFQAFQAVITFSVYPGAMFNGWIKVLIFTAIPAAFISHIPVQLLHTFDPWLLLGLLAFTAFSVGLAGLVFHVGLRRYESGNLMIMRA